VFDRFYLAGYLDDHLVKQVELDLVLDYGHLTLFKQDGPFGGLSYLQKYILVVDEFEVDQLLTICGHLGH
jgi:hypothetical protein